MNNKLFIKVLTQLSRYGAVHRETLKNDLPTVVKLVRQGYVRKVNKQGKVFYEFTARALPLLELQRQRLMEEAKMAALLHPQSVFYPALVEDLRFLDENRKEAHDFLFLGDWQLTRPVVPAQLELSKYRYYQQKGLE